MRCVVPRTTRPWLLHYATVALPADLNDSAVLNQHGNVALSRNEGAHAAAGFGVGFDIVLDEVGTFPLEPFAHLLRMGTAGGAEKLKPGHERGPPGFRG